MPLASRRGEALTSSEEKYYAGMDADAIRVGLFMLRVGTVGTILPRDQVVVLE